MKIKITSGNVTAEAELNNSETAKKIYEILPIKSKANTWGDEVYFSIPLSLSEAKDAKQEVEVGDLGFWAHGNGFCIFFGRTPASTSDKPKAASPVNVFGKVLSDVKVFHQIIDGDEIVVERV